MKKERIVWCSVFGVLCSVLIASCVIPAGYPVIDSLVADPQRNVIPQFGVFDAAADLTVLARFTDGETYRLRYEEYAPGYTPPDTGLTGERQGVVRYQGKTAYFTIYAYDPAEGVPTTNGNGSAIVVPTR